MKNSYRIVEDTYAGYEVQVKKWWFPIGWWQCYGRSGCNTHSTIEAAEKFARRKAAKGYVIKLLGKLP